MEIGWYADMVAKGMLTIEEADALINDAIDSWKETEYPKIDADNFDDYLQWKCAKYLDKYQELTKAIKKLMKE